MLVARLALGRGWLWTLWLRAPVLAENLTQGWKVASTSRALDSPDIQPSQTRTHRSVLAKPRICARDTACARLSTFSLVKMFFTCDFTVAGAMARLRAISLFDSPSAIN